MQPMDKQQTAVEWLYDRLTKIWYDVKSSKELLEQAKEMEKEQMIDFALECQEMFKHQILEKFNETYGGDK